MNYLSLKSKRVNFLKTILLKLNLLRWKHNRPVLNKYCLLFNDD